MGVIDILRTKGVAKVRNLIINLTLHLRIHTQQFKFLNLADTVTKKRKHSIKFILINQAHILRQTKLFIKLKRNNKEAS